MINSNDDRKKNRGVSLKASLDVDEEVGEENYALQPWKLKRLLKRRTEIERERNLEARAWKDVANVES